MVALELVEASNARLKELGPGLVALFVGGTSGIGEATLKAFVQNTLQPRVYVVGRSAEAAERITSECALLNKDGKVEFLQANVNELREVDRICKQIVEREKKLNLLVQSQGNLNMKGRDGKSSSASIQRDTCLQLLTNRIQATESAEGLDRKFTLNYYSRMRFITNLLPLLRTASATAPHFSRTLSILGPGNEGPLNLDDLELKTTFSVGRCASHTITMNDFMAEELARREPHTSFLHSSPGIVKTGIARELPLWARLSVKVLTPILALWTTSVEETGKRQLFLATSGIFPPRELAAEAPFAAGVSVPSGLSVAKGSDGTVGVGSYLVNWDGEVTGKAKLLSEYREKGVAQTVWEHTMAVFDRVSAINQKRAQSEGDD